MTDHILFRTIENLIESNGIKFCETNEIIIKNLMLQFVSNVQMVPRSEHFIIYVYNYLFFLSFLFE